MISCCIRFLGSRGFAYALLALYALILAIATWVESREGAAFAQEWIYHAPAFIAFQAFIALNLILGMLRAPYLRQGRYGLWLLHASIIVILGGALVTHVTSREGYMHLREGQTASYMQQRDGKEVKNVDLPFALELKDFILKRYPGSSSPSSYESELILHEGGQGGQKREVLIRMNHTLDVQGYRVFQLSYDPDERGSILLISEDWLGRRITYTGYLLLTLGFLLCFWSKQGRVRQLIAKLAQSSCFFIAGLLTVAEGAEFADVASSIVPAEEAQRFADLPMQDTQGRIVPVETFASQLLRKLHRDERVNGWNGEQFLLSLWLMPEAWAHIPFITAPNPDIAAQYGLDLGKDGMIAFADAFTAAGDYKFQAELEQIYLKKSNERSRYDKDMLKLDERLNLFHQLVEFQLVKLFPKLADPQQRWFAMGDDCEEHFEGKEAMFVSKILPVYLGEVRAALGGTGSWDEATHILSLITLYQEAKGKQSGLDRSRIEAELRYNDWRIFSRAQLAYFILGGAILLLAWLRLLGAQRSYRIFFVLLWLCVFVVAGLHAYGMGLRWYIASHAPWSNSYETMVYIAWMSAVLGLVAAWRSHFVAAISVLFAGIVLFVSSLSWMDPHMSPLVPVLQSLWLMFHVAVIVAAYGFFGIAFLLALSNLILMCLRGKNADAHIQRLSDIKEILLWIGLSLMIIGSCLGAIWANESWGRYWAWDPKETWALITILCYLLSTHVRMLPRLYSLYSFNVLTMFSFLSVLMTYFGVNYFLSGMHSYNSSQLPEGIMLYLCLSVGAMLLLAIVARLRRC